MDIKGKTALVTGGAIRVGKTLTLALARAGANVVINYNTSSAEAEQTVAEAEALGVRGMAVQADVSDAAQVQALVQRANQAFGGVDVLVNNASLFQKTPIPTDDFSAWHKVTGILINGTFYCANAVAPHMLEHGGVIINMIDLSAWEPWHDFSGHVVGKAGLWALTKQLALDLAPRVRVNAVCPGPALPPPNYTPERIARTARKTMLGRWGTPEDMADAVMFLIGAEYITAEVIVVDGGERYGHRKSEEA
ncbi:MAG: SDR family oxidoreductase [Anaerolineae bacterium]|nr:SDR family oxidoreductase [Anaerolineae bacterium]